ncbi:MAG: hypothetical protein EOP85_22040 [Verrucomicrobiaceae bacterium]|nr:MAG: hypothetical protein EOP85_22040 [Verrucomicrobiaceae bacterium]
MKPPKNIPAKMTAVSSPTGWKACRPSSKRMALKNIRAEKMAEVHTKARIRLGVRLIDGYSNVPPAV